MRGVGGTRVLRRGVPAFYDENNVDDGIIVALLCLTQAPPSSSIGALSGGTHKALLGGKTFWCCRAPVLILRAVFPRMNPCAVIP
jgi:hypothetical protein